MSFGRKLRDMTLSRGFVALAALGLVYLSAPAVAAQNSLGVVAVVNDKPVTEFAVNQRVKINQLLGGPNAGGKTANLRRKKALDELIDDILKKQEATRVKINIPKAEIDRLIEQIAKSGNDTVQSFSAKLKKHGIRMSALRSQIEAQIAWNTVLQSKYNKRVKVSDREVDRRLAVLEKKPRKTRRFLVLKQIVLGYEKNAPPGVIQSRYFEAQSIIGKYRGCRSLKKAISGVPSVRVRDIPGVPIEALPPQLVKILSRVGEGGITPPNRTQTGIELLAYCERIVQKPPKISREQVKNALMEEQYNLLGTRYLRDLRKEALIDRRGS